MPTSWTPPLPTTPSPPSTSWPPTPPRPASSTSPKYYKVEDPEALADMMEGHSVFGRVDPAQKRAMVRALQARGHVVAMTGDGVNDVLALKESDIGIAIGSGAPASRAVAQLVLIDGRFATLPEIVGEGRRVTSNVERVANLFITSAVYALGLSLAIVLSNLPFPFLPRHLTLVGSLTVGIPSFFLALAPSRRRARPGRHHRRESSHSAPRHVKDRCYLSSPYPPRARPHR